MSVARPEPQVEGTKGGKFQYVCVVCLADAHRQLVSCTPGMASLSSGATKTPRVQKNKVLRDLCGTYCGREWLYTGIVRGF